MKIEFFKNGNVLAYTDVIDIKLDNEITVNAVDFSDFYKDLEKLICEYNLGDE